MNRTVRSLARDLLPPIVVRGLKRLVGNAADPASLERPVFEYVGTEWRESSRPLGWSDPSIIETQLAKWEIFARNVTGTGALTIAPEADWLDPWDLVAHSTHMTFGYAVARAAHSQSPLRVLDWGGGIGHYHMLTRAFLGRHPVEYSVVDLPAICDAGRRVQPTVRFLGSLEACSEQKYGFVVASGALHYAQDWRHVLCLLMKSADGSAFLARVPVVRSTPSFVTVQHADRYGYSTDFVSWVFNREELIAEAKQCGGRLVREFMGEQHAEVAGAPERPRYESFLFDIGSGATWT